MFLAVVFSIAALAIGSLLLFVRVATDRAPGRTAKNERAKLFAGNFDRLSTACAVAAFITPETQLSKLDLGLGDGGKTIVLMALWILAAIVLHLLGQCFLAKVKD